LLFKVVPNLNVVIRANQSAIIVNLSMVHSSVMKRCLRTNKFIVLCIFSLNSVACAAFEFRLSTMFGLFEEEDRFERPVYPRRNMAEEYGVDGYRALVSRALDQDQDQDQDQGQDQDQEMVDKEIDNYGVDVSFPTHYLDFPEHDMDSSRNSYSTFLQGCKAHYKSRADTCDESEMDRMDMNLNQPPVMQNYTEFGFQKTRVPKEVMEPLKKFWELNKSLKTKEKWADGDTHINHWESATYMINVENPNLEGGGLRLKNMLWDAAHESIQKWFGSDTNYPLAPASLYGIRVYGRGSVLAPHVDRLPLVSSAIINVAQDVDEPWPLEVYGHDGKAYNVTLDVGDMLLYESHSVIHGRPFPLKGKSYANVFIHFEPAGHCVRHSARMTGEDVVGDAENMYRTAKQTSAPKVDETEVLPLHIVPGSMEAKRWTQDLPYVVFKNKIQGEIRTRLRSTGAHNAASVGNLSMLRDFATNSPELLITSDQNGWQPLHEAARGGHLDVVEFLIKKGANLNTRTNKGEGGTPLWWAEKTHGKNHPVSKLLASKGAISVGPK